MIPNYVQIDMVIVSINTGNHTISLNKHTIGLEIYNSTRQYMFRPMCIAVEQFKEISSNLSQFFVKYVKFLSSGIKSTKTHRSERVLTSGIINFQAYSTFV